MAKKSLLKSLLNLVARTTPPADVKQITPKEAVHIQLEYEAKTCDSGANPYAPPYIEIAKQLFSEKSEVFRAAVYYLVKIAENESKYAEQIVILLKDYANTATNKNEEEKAFLSAQIEHIEKGTHFLH